MVPALVGFFRPFDESLLPVRRVVPGFRSRACPGGLELWPASAAIPVRAFLQWKPVGMVVGQAWPVLPVPLGAGPAEVGPSERPVLSEAGVAGPLPAPGFVPAFQPAIQPLAWAGSPEPGGRPGQHQFAAWTAKRPPAEISPAIAGVAEHDLTKGYCDSYYEFLPMKPSFMRQLPHRKPVPASQPQPYCCPRSTAGRST